ncbi:MAG: DUF4340 domain-containing protein [Mariniblastus sp.]|nr:DUF4340 domain-containing protein [Mariniblastus sp.]
MRSATISTLMLAVLALLAMAAATYYYPWPEPQVETTVEQLFESYQGSQVRGMEIVQFNRDRGSLEKIKLVRRGDRWVIPSKQNYTASQGARIALAISSLSDLKVFEIMSDNQKDHLDFGVVDPEDYDNAANRGSLGTKLTLTDRNQKEIASLIIGLPVKDEANIKHFARITNQPNVYVIDYDPRVLSTDFASWVSTNPLQLAQRQGDSGQGVNAVDIDFNRLQGDDPLKMTKDTIYRAEIRPTQEGTMGVALLETSIPDSKELRQLTPTAQQIAKLTGMGQFLSTIVLNDVTRKDPNASKAIKSLQPFDPKLTESMQALGFLNCRNENGNFECDPVSGDVRIYTPTGVVMTMSFGAIAGTTQDGTGKLNYAMIITAGINKEALKLPKKPADLNEDPNSDENKAFQRSVQDAQGRIEVAQNTANELNKLHSDWYYIIGDDVIKRLRPEISIPPMAKPLIVPTDLPNQSEPESGKPNEGAPSGSGQSPTPALRLSNGTEADEQSSESNQNGGVKLPQS